MGRFIECVAKDAIILLPVIGFAATLTYIYFFTA